MRIIVGTGIAVLVGIALFEVTMYPSASERTQLALLFVVLAVVSSLAGIFLPKLASRSRRLIVTLFLLSLVSLVVASAGLAIAANRMFVSEHDLTLMLVVLGFGLVAAVAFAVSASSSMTQDVERMRSTASRVASGDLSARTDVERSDELGALAADIDALTQQLAEARAVQEEEDARRREFFAAVSHDLRTPLASMQVAAEAIVDGVGDDPDRYLASIQSDIDVLRGLVDDLFLLARAESGDLDLDPQPVDVTEVVDEAIEVVRPIASKKDVSLLLKSDRRYTIDSSGGALGRIVRNLLDNAVRHTPDGSTVTVAVAAEDRGVSIVVRDEGPGFSAAFAPVAFDSFTRSDPARTRDDGGAGLGLAIVRALVDALEGSVAIVPGDGGAVRVDLPATLS